jgi:hypothetical protein
MYIVPILVKTVQTTEDTMIKQVWLFLERNGSHCISVASVEDAKAFLKTNEFSLAQPVIVSGQFIYAPISATADLSSFYSWGEVRPNEYPMKEVWRSFLWVVDPKSNDDVWGTNVFLKDICIAGSETVHSIIGGYFKPN